MEDFNVVRCAATGSINTNDEECFTLSGVTYRTVVEGPNRPRALTSDQITGFHQIVRSSKARSMGLRQTFMLEAHHV